ncbi:hypothetical protein LOK49_LG02G03165 [Camellia lanceoleosa]|uniref:Uncharacterized protein n=1 Tax=Camellia lanceoleosa TaxID=1840588 RepID=A0ACC0ILB2_9ERIC|nr:hypothetical protein LOK49_LG02G03165 [Camellia lanceoleosa]
MVAPLAQTLEQVLGIGPFQGSIGFQMHRTQRSWARTPPATSPTGLQAAFPFSSLHVE